MLQRLITQIVIHVLSGKVQLPVEPVCVCVLAQAPAWRGGDSLCVCVCWRRHLPDAEVTHCVCMCVGAGTCLARRWLIVRVCWRRHLPDAEVTHCVCMCVGAGTYLTRRWRWSRCWSRVWRHFLATSRACTCRTLASCMVVCWPRPRPVVMMSWYSVPVDWCLITLHCLYRAPTSKFRNELVPPSAFFVFSLNSKTCCKKESVQCI